MMLSFQVIVIICEIVLKCATMNTSRYEITACYDNATTLDMILSKPKIVDVVSGSIVHLWCNFW